MSHLLTHVDGKLLQAIEATDRARSRPQRFGTVAVNLREIEKLRAGLRDCVRDDPIFSSPAKTLYLV